MKRLIFLAAALMLAAPALAQSSFPTPGGSIVNGLALMCPDSKGNMVPCSSIAPQSVTIIGPNGPEGGVSVSINPFRANAIQHGGFLAIGGSWQQVGSENLLRQRFFIENYCTAATQGVSTTESLFLTFAPTIPTFSPMTAAGSTELLPCGSYDTAMAVVGTDPVWVWAATINHRFQALEW